MIVIGLDKSLASTGLAIIDDNATVPIVTYRIKSEPAKRADKLKPTIEQRHDRMKVVEDRIISLLGHRVRFPDLCLIEGPSYGSPQGAHEIGGSWWRIVDRLLSIGVPVAEATPGQVKQYATGSGATSGPNKVEKHHVIEAVQRQYGDVGAAIRQNDEADALILAAIGARHLGYPVESAPPSPAQLAALKKIRWPERTLAL